MKTVYDIYQMLEKKNVILAFQGVMTSELLTSILQIMETKMDRLEETPKIKKKVFNILVECLQNLYHHIDLDEIDDGNREENSSLFMIAKTNNMYTITTGNYMKNAEVENLENKLGLINSMSSEELKTYYKEVLIQGTMSEKGTAGLGMIDIARKSGKSLEFNFLEINKDLTFFSLSVKIAD
ncbi:SiaB family protein kinase [Crocinitomix catalasitica]|uniref:SiaB family protein kinase n=1 Tax=Crocinitomix catalasitica TaxID=184607 RepID=UPI0004833A08|nr:SiaB family protein kinase [Crocinitomix catalasitica]